MRGSRNRGYIALISVLIVSMALITIMSSVSVNNVYILNDINDARKSYDDEQIIKSCAEDVLMRLNLENAIPSSIMVTDKQCSITINSNSGDTWDFTVSYSSQNYVYEIRINATRTDKVTVNSWRFIK